MHLSQSQVKHKCELIWAITLMNEGRKSLGFHCQKLLLLVLPSLLWGLKDNA